MIGNVLRPNIVNGKLFVLKRATLRALYVEVVDGDITEQFVVHRIKFQFTFHWVGITCIQFPVWLTIPGTVHKMRGQTLPMVVVELRCNYFSPGKMYVSLYHVAKSGDILLMQNTEGTLQGFQTIHQIPISVENSFINEEVQFAEGTNVQ